MKETPPIENAYFAARTNMIQSRGISMLYNKFILTNIWVYSAGMDNVQMISKVFESWLKNSAKLQRRFGKNKPTDCPWYND